MADALSAVSKCCHRPEIVEDGEDGAVLEVCGADSLRDFMSGLSTEPSRLDRMKTTAFASVDRFM